MNYTHLQPNQEINKYGLVYDVGSLYDFLEQIPDTRSKHGRQYPLALLLIWMIIAKLCGEDKPSGIAEWVAYREELWVEYQITDKLKTASHMTYRRVLQDILSTDEFEQLLERYHQQQLTQEQDIILSMDGKTLRGTIPRGDRRGVHLLAIYVPQKGLVLAQAEVGRKENEITIAPHLIRQVNLSGSIVIADAMHTQKSFCQQIIEQGGDYILTAKENQPRTRWAIEKLFIHEVNNLQLGASLSKDFRIATKVNKGHGRIEKRTMMTSTLLNEYLDWPSLAQVFRIEKVIWYEQGTRYTRHIRYGFTSLSFERAGPERLLELLQQYWAIENGLHYRRDVTMSEDGTRLSVGDSGQNMAILNNLVMGLCLSNSRNNLASARRYFDAHPHSALQLLLSSCPGIL